MRGRPAFASVVAVASVSLLAAGVWTARRGWHLRRDEPSAPSSSAAPALLHATPNHGEPSPNPLVDPLAGLDLSRMTSDSAGPAAPTGVGTARLTVDPELQRTALGLMSAAPLARSRGRPHGRRDRPAARLREPRREGPRARPLREATAPSASVFKIVTAAALDRGRAPRAPTRKQCYSGGEQRITAADLIEDPQRDRWCTTLAGAMGRSINTVFARLAKRAPGAPPARGDGAPLRLRAGRAVRRPGAGERAPRADRAARVRAHGGGLLELDPVAARRRSR